MADISNVKIGVCSVTYNGTDLGHTQGGVTVTYEPDIHETNVDKFGSTPAKVTLVGERLTATVPLAEATIANIQKAIPAASNDASKATIGGQVGDELTGALLVLHPTENDAGDLSENVTLYKAVPVSTVELPFMVDEERVFEVEFLAVIDESRDDGDQLGLIGDSSS